MRIATSADRPNSRAVRLGGSPLTITLRYRSGAIASGTPAAPVLNSSPPAKPRGWLFDILLLLLWKNRERLLQTKQFGDLS
jgi:hypothetical protein